jgi:uncharacterized protein
MDTLSLLLSSHTRAKFFRLLFNGDNRELYLRDISRLSDSAIGTVQQEAAKLLQLGLIIERRSGNRVYFHANIAHPLFPPIRDLVVKTSGFVHFLKDALKDTNEIEMAFVFGSMAGNTATPSSDIDLIVIGQIGLRSLSTKLKGPALALGREINPHVFTVKEFVERKKHKEHFIKSVLEGDRIFIIGSEDDLARMAS